MRMASSWAPVSFTVSLSPSVPVRLPVSTPPTTPECRAPKCPRPVHLMLSTSVPAPRLIVVEPCPLLSGHRHGVVAGAAGEHLDAGDRADGEVDRGRVGQHDLVALPDPPWMNSPAANWPLARLIVSLPAPPSIVSAPKPPVIVSASAPPVIVKASFWLLRLMDTPFAASPAEIASTPAIVSSPHALSLVMSVEFEVRMIVSVPPPRLIVLYLPMRMASSCAPVSFNCLVAARAGEIAGLTLAMVVGVSSAEMSRFRSP